MKDATKREIFRRAPERLPVKGILSAIYATLKTDLLRV
jgi:hypothetical protein